MKYLLMATMCLLAACAQGKTDEVQAGWSNEPTPSLSRTENEVSIVGHVLDRRTGEPVTGARIEAPGGRTAVSGTGGYFEITGFVEGESGHLVATWGQGLRADLQLRALRPGRLEVVLHLGQ